MMGKQVAVNNSVLNGEFLLEKVVRRYRLREPLSCELHRRSMCDAYEVRSGAGAHYLKVYMHGRRAKRDLDAEMALLGYLRKGGVGVAMPLARRDGTFLTRIAAPEGVRYAALFPEAPGRDLNESPEDDKAFGTMVARLHKRADRMRGPLALREIDWECLVDGPLRYVRPLMAQRREDLTLIEAIAEETKARVDGLLLPLRSTSAWGVCHGDLHGGDARIDGGGRVTLFDFDSSGYGWRALDLGVFLASDGWMDTHGEALKKRESRWRAFLEGYSGERDLHANELEAARLCPAIRHIYLMGIVLLYTIHREGNHWANDNFIDWHMAWFRWWSDITGPQA
jgi:Ser/Thr protein kinase RdoA (MazF antagonist)